MEGQAIISADVLSRYARDAAREVDGVSGLGEGALHRERGATVSVNEDGLVVEVHVELAWGRNAAEIGAEVQRSVARYLERMTNVRVMSVDVVIDGVGAPPAKQ